MKKIMFNDKYGLTQAVLEGRKTMTRRAIPTKILNDSLIAMEAILKAPFQEGEEVAVAQSYKDCGYDGMATMGDCVSIRSMKGWGNKMFVRADLMPHRIKITNIKVDRLQDINEDDCLKEGIERIPHPFVKDAANVYTCHGCDWFYTHPKDCFAELIDKVSGKGTWESNPWVFVYEFELLNS